MRPVGLPQLILLRWVNTPNLALAVLVIPAVAVDRWDRFAAAGAVGSTAFVAAVVLGVVSVVATMLAFHALTFVLQRPVPVDYVFSELFRFTQVPAPAFRGAAALSMVLALPIVLGVWAPVAALQGDLHVLAALAGLAAALVCVTTVLLRTTIRRFDGLGG